LNLSTHFRVFVFHGLEMSPRAALMNDFRLAHADDRLRPRNPVDAVAMSGALTALLTGNRIDAEGGWAPAAPLA